MRNPIKALAKRWVQEVLDDAAQAKQDACGHWVSGTWKEGDLYCDACDKLLNPLDAEAGQSQGAAPSVIEQRYVEKVLG